MIGLCLIYGSEVIGIETKDRMAFPSLLIQKTGWIYLSFQKISILLLV